jgi:hypothetical protein
MNLGTFLQTIITIVLIYLILALIASEIQENIAAFFELRAQRLKTSIQTMLGEDDRKGKEARLTQELYDDPMIKNLNQSAYSWLSVTKIILNPNSWIEWFQNNLLFALVTLLTLIVCLFLPVEIQFKALTFVFVAVFIRIVSRLLDKSDNTERLRTSCGPSYIDNSEIFARVMTSIIKNYDKYQDKSKPDPSDSTKILPLTLLEYFLDSSKFSNETKERLKSIADLSGSGEKLGEEGWTEFQNNLQKIFVEVQERSTGVYKRNAKGLSLIIGFLIAFIANADAFNIVNNLSKTDQNYRDTLIGRLEAESPKLFIKGDNSSNELTPDRKEIISQIVNETGSLPLGWDYDKQILLNENQLAKENEKINRETEDAKKIRLIGILNQNQEKINWLVNNNDNCQEDKKTKCFEELLETIGSNKDLMPYLSPDFTQKLRNRDEKGFAAASTKLLESLRKDRESKLFKISINSEELLEDAKNIKKAKLIKLLTDNQKIFESLSNDESFCNDNQCFEDLIEQINSNKDVVPFLDKDFKDNFHKRNKKGFSTASIKLLESLKKEQKLKFTELRLKREQMIIPLETSQDRNESNKINDFVSNIWLAINSNIQRQGGLPRVFFGWSISAIAISMGAPFWFDLLGNIMNVRNSGKTKNQ